MVLDVNQHNKTVLGTLKAGDLVEIDREYFQHWGVYIGNGDVVHKCDINVLGTSGSITDKAGVKQESLLKVAGNSKMEKNNGTDRNADPFSKEKIKKRALSRLGPASYNLLSDNCEHFASWCRNGIHKSNQADAAGKVVKQSIGTLAVAGERAAYIYTTITDGIDSKLGPTLNSATNFQKIIARGQHGIHASDQVMYII